jgi:GNAT superfamily N-acetyltransferase
MGWRLNLFSSILLFFQMLKEDLSQLGLKKTLAKLFFWKKSAVPSYILPDTLKAEKYSLTRFDCELKIFDKSLIDFFDEHYRKSRIIKAKYYLSRGYKGFVLWQAGRIIGDLWFTVKQDVSNSEKLSEHPDLKLLHLKLDKNEAYAFDLYLLESVRGKDLATCFMASVIIQLGKLGVTRVYGYYLKDNLPALWIHRLIGYKELPEISLSRFAFFRFSQKTKSADSQRT